MIPNRTGKVGYFSREIEFRQACIIPYGHDCLKFSHEIKFFLMASEIEKKDSIWRLKNVC